MASFGAAQKYALNTFNNLIPVVNSARETNNPVSIDPNIGNYVNALDTITGISSKNSAKSLDFARQQQDWSASQAAIANQFASQEAAKNREWQEYMSNTSHQREVADLKAAGLNPVLSASGGNGAAVTSGSAASASMPSGSRGDVDSSANNALVAILGHMLAAQTSIANSALSARTQEAVADKYTAMSALTAEMAANASMYGARQSAGASMYGADMQYQIQQDFPSSMVRILDSMLSGTGYGWDDIGGQIMDTALQAYDQWQGDHPTFWQTLSDKLKTGKETAMNWLNKVKYSNKKSIYNANSGSGRNF